MIRVKSKTRRLMIANPAVCLFLLRLILPLLAEGSSAATGPRINLLAAATAAAWPSDTERRPDASQGGLVPAIGTGHDGASGSGQRAVQPMAQTSQPVDDQQQVFAVQSMRIAEANAGVASSSFSVPARSGAAAWEARYPGANPARTADKGGGVDGDANHCMKGKEPNMRGAAAMMQGQGLNLVHRSTLSGSIQPGRLTTSPRQMRLYACNREFIDRMPMEVSPVANPLPINGLSTRPTPASQCSPPARNAASQSATAVAPALLGCPEPGSNAGQRHGGYGDMSLKRTGANASGGSKKARPASDLASSRRVSRRVAPILDSSSEDDIVVITPGREDGSGLQNAPDKCNTRNSPSTNNPETAGGLPHIPLARMMDHVTSPMLEDQEQESGLDPDLTFAEAESKGRAPFLQAVGQVAVGMFYAQKGLQLHPCHIMWEEALC